MRKILWLLLLLVGLGGSASAQSYEKIQLYCEKGGETVTTDGRTSTTRVQRSYPSCTVTVYNGGTLTLASIASDSIGTPKSNPFTADSDGYISFYATDGTYDVKMSGSGLAAPITRSGFWVITSAGGGSGITGSGTTNRFPIFTSSTAIGNSVFQQVGTSEFAPAATGKRINLGTGSQQVVEIANAAVTGTTQNRIAKLTGAPSTAVIATTTDTTKLVGIVIAGAGTAGNAQIVTNGNVSCEFDGATTAGNYVGASTTTNGKCKDLGATLPVSGVQVIGRVLQTIGSAGNADVFIFTGEQGRGGVSGSGTTAYLSYWTSSSALGATNSYYDTLNNLYTFGGNVDVANLGNSQFTIETDQVIFNGGVSRANNAIMQTMKATATQTGDFQRFTTSAGAARFRVDIDGDVLPRGVNYTWPSSLPASTGCLQVTTGGVISVVPCSVAPTEYRGATNVVADFACAGDGITNDTTCIANAFAAAEAATGMVLYFPAGTYLTDPITSTTNSLVIEGDGPGKSFIKSRTNGALLTFDNSSATTHSITIRDISFYGFGTGSGNNGLSITGANERFDWKLSNVRFSNFAGTSILSNGGAIFSSTFEDVDIDQPSGAGGHAIDILGAQTNTLIRTYVHNVATNKAAYRLRQGSFTLIGANGVDSGTNVNWGIFGQQTSDDGIDTYAQITMIGSNVEDWSATDGLIFRIGSIGSFYNTKFDTLTIGTYRAIKFNYLDVGLSGIFDAESGFALNGAASWTNSLPVHSYNPPFVQIGSTEISSYYDTNLSASVSLSAVTTNLNVGAARATTQITRLSLGTASGQGFDGNLLFGTDNTNNIGASGGQRPANIYVGTSVQMATGATTVGGQNWTITGGASPQYAFDDGTVAGRWQLVTGSYVQLGTTSAHDLKFLTNGTARWDINSSGHLIVDSGSLTIGLAAGNRPTIGYFSTSVNPGTPGTSTGSIVFGNASNSNTTTIQSGVAAASRTYTWPTNFGAAGSVLTDAAGNGTLSWAVPSASLTATYVGYGNGSNVLTGTSDLAYNTTTKTLTITSAASGVIDLATTSTNSAFKLNGATHPGTAGGFILPFVGGTNGDAPGLWWTSSLDYSTTSGIYISNGFNFQGANSTHDNLKINQGTASSSSGTTRYTFAPSSSLFTQNLSTGFTGSTHDAMQTDLISSGGAGGANFGVGHLFRLENASSSLADATRLAVRWTTATGGAETARFVVGNNSAGGGISDSFTVEADQYYGTVNALGNKSGSFTIDFNDGNYVTATATGNWTTVTFSNIKPGATYRIRVTQDGTGGKTWTPPTNFKYPGGVSGNILTGTANAVDVFICETFDSTNLWCNGLFDVKNP